MAIQPPLPTLQSDIPQASAADTATAMSVRNDNTAFKDLRESLVNDHPTVLVNGQTINDLVRQTTELQADTQNILNNYPDANGSNGENKNYFNVSSAADNLFSSLNSKKSFAVQNQGVSLGEGKDFARYSDAGNFKTFGYTPGMGEGQEYKYGEAMTWGDTMGRAFAGGGHLAYDTFVEGWKGWGRMASALYNWDSSKLMGSEEERYEMAKHQEDIMNKYAIYDTETSKDSLWNRQFFGTMLQQSGFAVGAGLQFAMENFVTGGLSNVFKATGLGAKLLASGVKATATAGELISDTKKVMDVVTKSERITNGIANAAKRLVPMYGTFDDIAKMSKAGAGFMQMSMTGLGGIKRGLSEFNMARSESIYEAAGTYKQLKDRLVEDFVTTNGREPNSDEIEKINQSAENASSDNFLTNMGVLSVMNRIQFDNMFNSFNKGRKIFSESATNLGEEAFTVAGKIEGKAATRAYEKSWFFGKLGAVKSIAQDFGKKQAAWEATKMLGKGLMKIEGSEGIQELIQNASGKGLEDYYYDLYHGKKGYTGRVDAVLSSMQNPLTDAEGMKTFLMGALTGALISPMTKIVTKGNESIDDAMRRKKDPNYKSRKQEVEENLNLVNQLYKDPTQFKKEWIANVKVQNKAAQTMEEAAKNHNEYVFYNAKDSAFAKTISSAIKLDMFDTIRDTLTDYGNDFSDEDFKKAFDIDPTSQNRKDVKSFMTNIGQQMDEYYTTFNNLKDEYGDRVLPELYQNNGEEKYAEAKLAKFALDDAIEMLATNVHKSKQAVKRASALQTEMGKSPNIGGSSVEILSKMGSEQAAIDTIKLLENEISDVEKGVAGGMTLTKEQKENLKNKKEELAHTKAWQEAHAELINNSDESYSPAAEKRAYQAYADLINLYNKRSKLNTVVSKADVDNNFVKIIDYMRLNKDNKAYVDAMNLLADPNNINLITSSIISAHRAMNEIFKKEHKAEVKAAGDTTDEEHEDDLKEETKNAEAKKAKDAADLEKHLQEEYNKVKKAAEGTDIKVPDYETWKKQAGVSVATRYNRAKAVKELLSEISSIKLTQEAYDKVAAKFTAMESNLSDADKKNIRQALDDKQAEVTKALEKTGLDETSDIEIKKAELKKQIEALPDDMIYATHVTQDEVAKKIYDTQFQFNLGTALQGTIGLSSKQGLLDLMNNLLDGNSPHRNQFGVFILAFPKSEFGEASAQRKVNLDTIESDMIDNYPEFLQGNIPTKFNFGYFKDGKLFTKSTETTDIEKIKKLIGEKDDETLIDWDSVTEFNKEGNGFKKGETVTVNDILWNLKEGLKDAEAKLQTILGTEDRKYYIARKNKFSKLISEIAALQNEEPIELEIEPEDKAGEYRKAYVLVKDFMEGKDENNAENLELFSKYPNLIEEFKQVELKRREELKTTKNPTAVKDKYDQLIRDVIAKGKPFVVEDEEDTIPAHAQGLDRIKKAQMESDTLYADRDFQVGYRQVEPSNSLGNRTDNFEEPTTGTGTYTRNGINTNYVFDVATQEFPLGSRIVYKVITDQAEYDKMGANRLTGEKYNASIIFDKDGKVKQEAYDDVPIGVYAVIRGQERWIGTVHEPLWIQIKKAGKYPHIAEPEGIDIEEHVKKEVAKNRKIRKTILDSFNKNSKFVISGTIESKSKGILKMVNDPGLLKDRVNSKIGEGGSKNRHGYFAIMRNSSLQTDVNVQAENVVETEAFSKNADKYSGIPALMLPTPNGDYMPTFIGLPKIDRNQAEFILEAWKVFKGFTQNPELAEAVYAAVGRDLVGEPNINVLSEYISQYYTTLNHDKEKPLSSIGNGSDVAPGQAIFDIDAFGNIILEVKDVKTKEWFNNDGKPIRAEKDIPANMIDLLQNLRTTIKFNDRKNDNLRGINSTEKITFLSMENGKLISKDMTYNENLLQRATTLVEKGTQSENSNKDWVYFANPVLKMTMDEVKKEDAFDEKEEQEFPDGVFEPEIEDDFAALERMSLANLLSEDQVEQEAEKCTPDPFGNANPFADA